QLDNAANALAAIEVMQARLPVGRAAIESGLKSVYLPGRFQVIATQPQILLDVTHNPHAAHALADNLRQSRPAGRTLAVFAMLADKDIAGVVTLLAPEIDHWYLSAVNHARSASVSQLLEIFNGISEVGCHEGCVNLVTAYRQACLEANENDRIIVFGSFFTVAEIMQILPASATSVTR